MARAMTRQDSIAALRAQAPAPAGRRVGLRVAAQQLNDVRIAVGCDYGRSQRSGDDRRQAEASAELDRRALAAAALSLIHI